MPLDKTARYVESILDGAFHEVDGHDIDQITGVLNQLEINQEKAYSYYCSYH